MRNQWLLVLAAALLAGCGPERKAGVARGLDEYARQARALQTNQGDMDGSLWTEQAGYADGFRDVKARRLADIVTIEVLESTSAVTEATTQTVRESDITKSAPALFGLEKRVAELPNLASLSQSSTFAGDGATSRTSVLATQLTARVIEVFPNRNLLIEANREITLNGERQIMILRGVIRPADISPANTVSSSRIAEMELSVTGRGTISDAQKPGLLFKLLSGIWPF
ncbi:MAG: flagellar basal body L-ring protein FlgH [Acidobacteriota bacterium]